jgi:multisubunit Na+/H+ antiporter MnhE subunit
MLNFFNLFLFLLAAWFCFMVGAQKINLLYIFFGVVSSILVAGASYRMKLFDKKSELLYLSLGFYRHFSKIFISNFFSSILLISKMALSKNSVNPLIFNLKFDENNEYNTGLLIASINMTSGLFVIGSKENELLIHVIDENYLKKFNLHKTHRSLTNVNDDNLI